MPKPESRTSGSLSGHRRGRGPDRRGGRGPGGRKRRRGRTPDPCTGSTRSRSPLKRSARPSPSVSSQMVIRSAPLGPSRWWFGDLGIDGPRPAVHLHALEPGGRRVLQVLDGPEPAAVVELDEDRLADVRLGSRRGSRPGRQPGSSGTRPRPEHSPAASPGPSGVRGPGPGRLLISEARVAFGGSIQIEVRPSVHRDQ